MSLFVVNRYQGNDEELGESKSEDHLSALLKKIAERKKRKAAEIPEETETTSRPEPDESQTKKKRKKRKTPNDDSFVVDNENKITRKEDTTSEDIQQSNETIEEQTIAGESEDLKHKSGKKPQDYLVLGSDSQKKKQIVKRVLPEWLAHPEVVPIDLNNGPPLEELQSVLVPKIIETLRENGTDKLFPVQARVIPWLLKCNEDRRVGWWPQDLCVSAPTGSGKTLAYVLPLVQLLQSRLVRKVRCLVVLPVQELAAQVYKVMITYTAHTKLRVAVISGASSFEQEQSNLVKKTALGKYTSRVDIVVATPGRLVDHIERTQGFSLNDLQFLVIDEADRATDWLQHLPAPHSCTPPLNLANLKSRSNRPAQKLLFSATLSQDPEKLSRLGLFQPKLFTSVVVTGRDDDVNLDMEMGDFAGRYTSPDELTERAVQCSAEYKPLALFQLLMKSDGVQKALVFANSGQTAHRLALLIQTFSVDKGLTVAEISAQLAPKQREEVLQKFIRGDFQVLVSSDALARGVDVPGVKLVVSYDLPKHIKGYIHRAGRTGRAGTPGIAISLLTPGQVGAFSKMLTAARKTVPTIETMDLESVAASVDYQSHVEQLKEIVDKEQTDALQRLKSSKRRHGHKPQ